jgi:hypothetical protein
MKKKSLNYFWRLILVCMASISCAALPKSTNANLSGGRNISSSSKKVMMAFSYPWYSTDSWYNPLLIDQPTPLYSSDDVIEMGRQIDQAKSAGISVFLSSWWGPDTYTDQNFRSLLRVAEQKQFKVAIHFETRNHGKPRSAEEIESCLKYIIKNYGSSPAYFQSNGKPLVVFAMSNLVPLETWTHIFSSLKKDQLFGSWLGINSGVNDLSVFDGYYLYWVLDLLSRRPEAYQQLGKGVRDYNKVALKSGEDPKIWAATIQPGYDEKKLPRRKGIVIDRDNGKVYQMTCDKAIASNPDWIIISTWNEWWENSYIEPGKAYGRLYLELTKKCYDKWVNSSNQ